MRQVYGAQLVNKTDAPAAIDTIQADTSIEIVAVMEADSLKCLIVYRKIS